MPLNMRDMVVLELSQEFGMLAYLDSEENHLA